MLKCVNTKSIGKFRTVKIPMQGLKKNNFTITSSSTMVGFLPESFVDQMKTVITEKHEFKKRPLPKFFNPCFEVSDYQLSDGRNRIKFSKGFV